MRSVLTITAAIRQAPPDHRGGHELALDEVSNSAVTYEEALTAIEQGLPAGWQIIHVRVDR